MKNFNNYIKENSDFYDVFYNLDYDYISNFLENGGDANIKNDSGENILTYKVPIKVAKLLIENGTDVNNISDDELTPLIAAINRDNFPLVKLLVENGADVNKVVNINVTPLKTLFTANMSYTNSFYDFNKDIGNYLIKNGADVNYVFQNDTYLTKYHKHLGIVNFLLTHRANVSTRFFNLMKENFNKDILIGFVDEFLYIKRYFRRWILENNLKKYQI